MNRAIHWPPWTGLLTPDEETGGRVTSVCDDLIHSAILARSQQSNWACRNSQKQQYTTVFASLPSATAGWSRGRNQLNTEASFSFLCWSGGYVQLGIDCELSLRTGRVCSWSQTALATFTVWAGRMVPAFYSFSRP